MQLTQDTVSTLSRASCPVDETPPPRQRARTAGGHGRLVALAVVALLSAARVTRPVTAAPPPRDAGEDRGLRELVDRVILAEHAIELAPADPLVRQRLFVLREAQARALRGLAPREQ